MLSQRQTQKEGFVRVAGPASLKKAQEKLFNQKNAKSSSPRRSLLSFFLQQQRATRDEHKSEHHAHAREEAREKITGQHRNTQHGDG
jgi:hypothetical protein